MSWIQNHLNYVPQIKQYIPNLLHIVWVGKSPQPESLPGYIAKWKELMPHWTIRVWTNEDLTKEEIREDVLEKINQSDKGTQKADILKYYIVWKYGGVYVDADVIPMASMDPLLYMSDLVVCNDIEISWDFISVGFFAASPNHPVLSKAVDICMDAELNTHEPHLATGPYVFGRAVSQIGPLHEKYTSIEQGSFYATDKPFGSYVKFGHHIYAHNWDT